MLKLVFFLAFFSLVPLAFAQVGNPTTCDELSEENPIIVTTDKQFYDHSDDKIIVSICMMPDVYHKHIQMSIYDSFGIEIERIIDPGFPCPDDCLADELYFFVQEVPIGSFEKGQQFTVEVHASGIYETTFFEFGEKILHDICQNVSDENPIAVSTNTRYYEVGDAGTVFGCVSQDAGIKEITITISLGDELALEEKIIPEMDGFFSAEFVIDDKFRIAHWAVKASADEEYSADGFIVSQRADKSFFRTDVVESVIDDQTLLDFTPTDISWDDKKLLLSAFQKLAIIDLENRAFQEINIPIELENCS